MNKITNLNFLEAGDKHYYINRTIEQLLDDLCNENSDFHVGNPAQLKKRIAQAILKRAFKELSAN